MNRLLCRSFRQFFCCWIFSFIGGIFHTRVSEILGDPAYPIIFCGHDQVGSFGMQFHRRLIVEFEDQLPAGVPQVPDLHAHENFVVEIKIFFVFATGRSCDEHEAIFDGLHSAGNDLFDPQIPRDPLKSEKMHKIHVLKKIGVSDRDRRPVLVCFPHSALPVMK